MSSWRLALLRLAVLGSLVFSLLAMPQPAEAATWVVNTSDDDIHSTVCDERHCSLRDAIADANRRSGPDRIRFDIPGPGPHVILLQSALPPITDDQTYLEGDSEPDYEGQPVIVLDGSNLDSGCALNIAADGVGVFGLSVINTGGDYTSCGISVTGEEVLVQNNFIGLNPAGRPRGNRTGISLHGPGAMVLDNIISGNGTGIVAWVGPQTIQGNRIGTDPAGTYAVLPRDDRTDLPVGSGITLETRAAHVLIGGVDPGQRNLISGLGVGISVLSILGNEIVGNYVGTDVTGSRAVSNWIGIDLPRGTGSAGEANRVHGNVISGNWIGVWGGWSHDWIAENLIGTDARGEDAVGNREAGIHLDSGSGIEIESNVVSGNDVGIQVSAAGGAVEPSGTLIRWNLIGTDAAGEGAIANRVGVHVNGGFLTSIGGDEPGHGNVISGNEIGVLLEQGSVVVRGNKIGMSAREGSLPNDVGIQITCRDELVQIDDVGGGNKIAFNTSHGVWSLGGTRAKIRGNQIQENGGHGVYLTLGEAGSLPLGAQNTISRNSIYNNAALGIGVDDPDVNFGVRPPVLVSATGSTVSGMACAGCMVEVFLASPDPSGAGEGKTYLASTEVERDGSFRVSTAELGPCDALTATATDSLGNTSEFSENLGVGVCAKVTPPLALTWIVIAGGGGAALLVILRRRAPDWSSLPWAALGGLIGVGLAVVVLMTPNVQIAFPEDGAEEQAPPPGNQPPPQQVPPTVASPEPTVTLTASPSPPPTETLEPTATPTATLGPPQVTAAQNVNCRFGPGTIYDVVGYLLQGQSAPIVGQDARGSWWAITVPDRRQPCWVSGTTVQASGDVGSVEVLVAPPTPTPSPTPKPEGCWVWNANLQQNLCVVPCPDNPQPGGACTP